MTADFRDNVIRKHLEDGSVYFGIDGDIDFFDGQIYVISELLNQNMDAPLFEDHTNDRTRAAQVLAVAEYIATIKQITMKYKFPNLGFGDIPSNDEISKYHGDVHRRLLKSEIIPGGGQFVLEPDRVEIKYTYWQLTTAIVVTALIFALPIGVLYGLYLWLT